MLPATASAIEWHAPDTSNVKKNTDFNRTIQNLPFYDWAFYNTLLHQVILYKFIL